MNRIITNVFFAIAASGLAYSQDKCDNLRAVLQARLELPAGWVGDAVGTIGEADSLIGTMRAVAEAVSTNDGGIGVEQGLKLLWDFGAQGTITTEIPFGLVLEPVPGPHGVGAYRGVGKIISGTGKFEKMGGTILVEGAYVIWFGKAGDPSTVQGRWNGDVTMRVCRAN